MNGGDYVFFHLDLFGYSLQGAHGLAPRRPWERGDRLDSSARQAFQVGVCAARPGTPGHSISAGKNSPS